MIKKIAKKTVPVDITIEEAVDTLWGLKAKKDEIDAEYKEWDKFVKSKIEPGVMVTAETVSVILTQTEKLELTVAALKAAYPDTYEECLQVVMKLAEEKYGREELEKIGNKVPYQKRLEWLAKGE